MDILAFGCMMFGLQLFYWIVGYHSARKGSGGRNDYFLAGRSVSFFPLMMTFLGTMVGGGVILGAAEEAYRFGWPVLLYPLGAALGLICLGLGIGQRLSCFQVQTVAQVFEVVYQSRLLKRIASLLSIVSLLMILAAQIMASQKFLTGLGWNNPWIFALFWMIVIVYTAQGGLRAVISTDMAQAAVFCAVFFLILVFVLWAHPSVSFLGPLSYGGVAASSGKWCGWLFMPMLFMVFEQDIAQRCFAGASPRVVSRASIAAGVCMMLVCIVPVWFGCLAHSVGIAAPMGGSILMAAVERTTNPWISACVGCAILAAIISTATSLINAIGSNVSNDFQWSQKFNGKLITGAISVAALLLAFGFNNVVDLLIQSFELSVSCLCVPAIMAIFSKRGNERAALISIACGLAGFILFRQIPMGGFQEMASVGLSLLGYVFGDVAVRIRSRRVGDE